jgi:hypothetical protein
VPGLNLMKMLRQVVLMVSLIGATSSSLAYCYSIFDSKNNLVHQSVEAPIDMSKPVSEGMAAAYPGHHLVVTETSYCPYINSLAGASAVPMQSGTTLSESSPLFRKAHAAALTGGEAYTSPYLGSPSYNSGGAYSSRGAAGTDVNVRSYTRSDGTSVRAHTRSAPGRR